FVSAVGSQGSCVNTAGQVRCALGTLPTGTNAVVTIRVTPTASGTIIHRAVVSRAEADPFLSINSAILATTVSPPTLSISDATVREGDSGTTNAVFLVRLTASNNAAVTVSYSTADGTATAGSDYLSTNGTLTF